MHAMVVISVQMLDAGYLTLAIQECTHGELQNHPASRNQYPGSGNNTKSFRPNGLCKMQYSLRLLGLD
jgi:hypothetical protein